MTSEASNRAGGGLFDAEDYTTWCRGLYQHKPFDPGAHILFESTISEPTDLLRGVLARAFAHTMTDRFVSVFGNGNGFLIDALARRYGVGADQVVCTTSAANAIAMLLRTLPLEKKHVLVETPCFDLLQHVPRSFGFDVSTVTRLGDAYDIDPEAFRRALRPNTGLVILTNPHNPTGAVLPPERLKSLAKIAAQAGVQIAVDEVYADFLRDDGFIPAARLAPNLISINSLTKVYGLFSLRCGWMLADPQTTRAIEDANARIEFGVSKLSHAAAALVIENIAPFDAWWRDVLAANRPVLEKHAAAMIADGLIAGAAPSSGCMYFPRIVDHPDTNLLAQKLWEDHGIIVAPGEFFGQPGNVRLGFGFADGRLDEGLAKLHQALLSLRRSRRPTSRAAGVVR